MNKLARVVDGWLIPIVLLSTWALMFASANLRGLPAIVALGAFAMVWFLWSMYRELRVHAAASRHAAQGDPDELLKLANAEIERRWLPRSRVPFHIYRSIGHQLRGEWPEARSALQAADLDRIGGKSRRSWGILHASQRINLLTQAGDAAGARKVLDQDLRPHLRFVPGAGADVIGTEAEARVLLAEGKTEEALPKLERLARDVRLGPATRAICRHLAAGIIAATDPAAADAARADAAKLAPKIALPQNLPTKTTPAPSADT